MSWVEMDDDQRAEVGEWVVRTVELFGATRATAYLVAGTFMRGLDREAQLDGGNVSQRSR